MPHRSNKEVFETVTAQIIGQIEAGASGWRMPWHSKAGQRATGEFAAIPTNQDGRPYHGINVLLLWAAGAAKGYESNVWGTFEGWRAKGMPVRKGEKSAARIVKWGKFETKESKAARKLNPLAKPDFILYAKDWAVFNSAQVEGYTAPAGKPMPAPAEPVADGRIAHCEAFFAAVPAIVRHGGNRAYYSPFGDYIGMPDFDQFDSAEDYYSTRGHESVHWTGGNNRCPDREFGKRFGDEAYAVEELVAELGAAFLCAHLKISNEPRPDHAKYLAGWLKVLKANAQTLSTVANRAQAAVDFIIGSASDTDTDDLPIAA